VTGLAGLLLAVVTGSAGLLGDAIHNLSDVSASAVVSPASACLGVHRPNAPYGLERAQDLTRVGVAMVIWPAPYLRGWQSQIDLKIPGHLPGLVHLVGSSHGR
jgi:divalent metal cation (Fe/Co/Zn/Cd) transporter